MKNFCLIFVVLSLFIFAGCENKIGSKIENSDLDDSEFNSDNTEPSGNNPDTGESDTTSDNSDSTDDSDTPSEQTDDADAPESDDFKESYDKSDYEEYVLFKGEGIIQEKENENFETGNATGESVLFIDGETYSNFDEITFFLVYTSSGEESALVISVVKIIDEENDIKLSMSFVLSPTDLEKIRDYAEDPGDVDEFDFAPFASISKYRIFKDKGFTYSKNIAVNQQRNGRMQLFYDENSTFAAGENLKIAFDTQITSSEDRLREPYCWDFEIEDYIDCPEDIEALAGF